jgi:hypothetical protein
MQPPIIRFLFFYIARASSAVLTLESKIVATDFENRTQGNAFGGRETTDPAGQRTHQFPGSPYPPVANLSYVLQKPQRRLPP